MQLYKREEIKLRPGLEDTPDRRRMYHGHMAQVTGIDIALGKMLKQLKNMNADENTLIAFTADHGDMLESHNAQLPKQYPHDYSNRIPFIIKYPNGIKAGLKSNTLLGTMDILPTILGFMNIETDQVFDGKDLSEKILLNNVDENDYVPIWNYRIGRARNSNWRGVETERYTYSTSKESENSMINTLFDREKDPYQLTNLYNSPNYKEVQKRLETYTKEWMNKYDDNFYGAEEFNKVQPDSKWTYNYKYSPLELLKNNQ